MADKKALMNGLNQDLANELGAAILYLYQTSTATGWDGEELREFLTPEITGEMQHAIFLAEKIAALGGKPITTPTQYKSPKDVKGMLKYDLKLEREAIENYSQRAMQAEEAGEIGLKIKIEEIIVEETGHAEQIDRILKGM
ncbi:MAG: ferritin-like domain-containing protein [Ignavibacteria bacterium]|nr:ferritin-like domain-containing protein [Ignavibacteria bacterium]MBI3765615.1 ferritin-like domain-containing protein [Ignavibacteriales bacterium]